MKPQCNLAQGFGANANPLYAGQGLKGHTGVDNACGYGTPIKSYFQKEYVYKILDKDHPANDGSGFTGCFTLVDNGVEVFEFLYGHGDYDYNMLGKTITQGTQIGTEGNHGDVYSGGIKITLEMQQAGDHRGAHRHDQKRPCKKVRVTDPKKNYLLGYGTGLFQDQDGFYYEVINFNNGYNGCVDWTLPTFPRDLRYIPLLGSRGDDVVKLQKILTKMGLFKEECTGYFGPVTKQAVTTLQTLNGITPTGYFGPLTRAFLEDWYNKNI